MKKKELLSRLRAFREQTKIEGSPKNAVRLIDSAITVIEKTDAKQTDIALYRRHVIDRIEVTKGAMILDGYEPEDSCIKFLNELIKEI